MYYTYLSSPDLALNTQIDPLTRRLQLIDATGGIDVLIPDLPLTWNSNDIFEVKFLFASTLPSLFIL